MPYAQVIIGAGDTRAGATLPTISSTLSAPQPIAHCLQEAEVIFAPYSYLLDPVIRRAMAVGARCSLCAGGGSAWTENERRAGRSQACPQLLPLACDA